MGRGPQFDRNRDADRILWGSGSDLEFRRYGIISGNAYLKRALEAQSGDIRLGLAGYNAGINGAQKPESAWPAETIRYVYWGTGIYADAADGKNQSDRLNEWLAASD